MTVVQVGVGDEVAPAVRDTRGSPHCHSRKEGEDVGGFEDGVVVRIRKDEVGKEVAGQFPFKQRCQGAEAGPCRQHACARPLYL